MKLRHTLLGVLPVIGLGALASADQHSVDDVDYHNRERGELSPGTEAPTVQSMVESIKNAPPSSLIATLEYGERVACQACVPLLERKLYESSNPRVREISAWWLRRRVFAKGKLMRRARTVLASSADPVQRSRAAEALGEFMDPNALVPLEDAALNDSDAMVRASAVKALGRLNHSDGSDTIAQALGDSDLEVRRSAVEVASRSGVAHPQPLIDRLSDTDAQIRSDSALVLGQLSADAAVPSLVDLLGDAEPRARKAAAWSLGRIGGARAEQALSAALPREQHPQVRDALEIALQM